MNSWKTKEEQFKKYCEFQEKLCNAKSGIEAVKINIYFEAWLRHQNLSDETLRSFKLRVERKGLF